MHFQYKEKECAVCGKLWLIKASVQNLWASGIPKHRIFLQWQLIFAGRECGTCFVSPLCSMGDFSGS